VVETGYWTPARALSRRPTRTPRYFFAGSSFGLRACFDAAEALTVIAVPFRLHL